MHVLIKEFGDLLPAQMVLWCSQGRSLTVKRRCYMAEQQWSVLLYISAYSCGILFF